MHLPVGPRSQCHPLAMIGLYVAGGDIGPGQHAGAFLFGLCQRNIHFVGSLPVYNGMLALHQPQLQKFRASASLDRIPRQDYDQRQQDIIARSVVDRYATDVKQAHPMLSPRNSELFNCVHSQRLRGRTLCLEMK